MSIIILITAISLLIFINAFYVAAQFSSVVSRRPRLAQIAEDGESKADFVLSIVEDPRKLDTYVATCQVGITVSSLALGFYAQARIMTMLEPLIDQLGPGASVIATSITALAILTFLTILQVILGELLPKNVGLLHPERLAILTAPSMRLSMRILGPLIWLLNGSGLLVLRLIGSDAASEHAHAHSPSEIEIMVQESSAGGVLDDEERRLLVNTLRLRHATAQRVMIPRNTMIAAPVESSCSALFTLLADSPYSRLPLYSDSLDSIVGAVHLKDLLCAVHANEEAPDSDPITPRDCLNPVLFIPESADIGKVMSLMQDEHQNLAIVIDEYGGTAGLLALEDLIEEIVGEFNDEFDIDKLPVELVDGDRLKFRGDVPIDDFEELLDVRLDSQGIETVGGLILASAGRVPATGEIVFVQGLPVRADHVSRNRIVHVSVQLPEERMAHVKERLKDM